MDKEDDVEVTLYYLIDPITNDVRYIGRTKNTLNRRLNGHLSKAIKGNKSHKNDWIRSILSKGLKPKIAEIKKVSGWRGSYLEEIKLIEEHLKQGYDLVNHYDRGIGHLRNVLSDEVRKNISDKVKQLHKEGKLSSNRRKVFVFDLEGVFIKEFNSLVDCAKWLNIKPKHLDSYFTRKDKTIKGFQIIREGEDTPTKYVKPSRKNKGTKPIFLLNVFSGSHIRFNSHNDCLKFLGKTSSSYIHTYLNKDIICQNKYKIKSTNE